MKYNEQHNVPAARDAVDARHRAHRSTAAMAVMHALRCDTLDILLTEPAWARVQVAGVA